MLDKEIYVGKMLDKEKKHIHNTTPQNLKKFFK